LIHGVEGQRPDTYYILADFKSYQKAHEQIISEYYHRHAWAKKCILNIARSGKFSSDRTIQNYVDEIWRLERINVNQ